VPPPEVFYDGLIVLLIILQVFTTMSLWHGVAINMLLESVQRTPADSHIAETAVPDLWVSGCGENKPGVWETIVDFPKHQWPGPILKTVILLHHLQ
jgi:hypothetical protein